MLFGIITAALVAFVALLLGLALLRARTAEEPAAAYDLRVYRDQLKDVERDLTRGVLSAAEAERLRLEISRRVLEADRAVKAGEAGSRAPKAGTLLAAAAGVAVLASAFGIYSRIGAAGYPDQPIAGRIALADELYKNRPSQEKAETTALAERGPLPAPEARITDLMEQLRKAVAERPNDIKGLELLARNEAGVGNFHDAWQAQSRVIALKGDAATDADYATLAELMIVATNGFVTPEAEAALAQAMQKNPGNGTARYYIGLMMVQNGRADRAFRIWAQLLEDGPENAPWIATIRENIEGLAWLAGEGNYTPPPPALKGPDADAVASAAEMAPEDRQAMIRDMVDGLNERLTAEGGSAAEWARLIGALGVLGDRDAASAALAKAEAAYTGKPDDLAQIHAAAATAGIDR
ncbi:c-type cytochrome biogenesis protein CcmI [Phaeovulum sp.]|uniref:c-type cytochrome biogenesis protein CcmI n=1 Tax=Phaeovulum sp. TaxID=2934796 RepID=UPI0039E40AA3